MEDDQLQSLQVRPNILEGHITNINTFAGFFDIRVTAGPADTIEPTF